MEERKKGKPGGPKEVILGPPGTGKTTRLLDIVEHYLQEGITPDQIGYFSYTVRAATEASTRAIKQFSNYIEKDFKSFRTLHSLALAHMPKYRNRLMQPADYKDFGKKCNINFNNVTQSEEDGVLKTSNEYLNLINLSVITKKSIIEVMRDRNYRESNIIPDRAEKIHSELQAYKKAKGLIDFNDLLIKFAELDYEHIPSYEVLIIDEAQDLSTIQWDVVAKLVHNSRNYHIAGDDDQAIYVWAGASVDLFRNLTKIPGIKVTELTQSYRVPKLHYYLAKRVIERDAGRIPKKYLPADREGVVERPSTMWNVDMRRPGHWLIIANEHKFLLQAEEMVKQKGLLYIYHNKGGISDVIIKIIGVWEKFRQGGIELKGEQVKEIYKYMGKNVAHGYKNGKKSPDDLDTYDIIKCIEGFGLLTKDSWDKALIGLNESDIAYLKRIQSSGGEITGEATVRLSTISSIKGAEADNVILFSDIGYPTYAAIHKGDEEAHRKFYVGLTRSKNYLAIVKENTGERSYGYKI